MVHRIENELVDRSATNRYCSAHLYYLTPLSFTKSKLTIGLLLNSVSTGSIRREGLTANARLQIPFLEDQLKWSISLAQQFQRQADLGVTYGGNLQQKIAYSISDKQQLQIVNHVIYNNKNQKNATGAFFESRGQLDYTWQF